MNKLFKLKNWLTLEETARRLTTSFQENLSEADCLQLALDGHIKISALIEKSKYGILCNEGDGDDIFSGFIEFMRKSGNFSDNILKTAEDHIPPEVKISRVGNVFRIPSGIYDLPMIGAERLDVLYICSQLQGREPATFICMEGPFIENRDGLINIVEPFNENNIEWKVDFGVKNGLYNMAANEYINESNYHKAFHPADGLRDVEFVFRRENIEAFENSQLEELENTSVTLNGCLGVIGCMLDSLKNTPSKGRRWTQEALKNEMAERSDELSTRSIDNYFSLANKAYKS